VSLDCCQEKGRSVVRLNTKKLINNFHVEECVSFIMVAETACFSTQANIAQELIFQIILACCGEFYLNCAAQ
jgi:hypothetical protein